MKIRDLDLDQYVVVYDMGKSEYSEGMTVIGCVEEIVFNDDNDNVATINSLGKFYDITDNNEFVLWSMSIKGKTERISKARRPSNASKLLEKSIEDSEEYINKVKSNDLQQRKRNDAVNHPSHYNYGEIEVIDFIEQITQHYNPNVAYHIYW